MVSRRTDAVKMRRKKKPRGHNLLVVFEFLRCQILRSKIPSLLVAFLDKPLVLFLFPSSLFSFTLFCVCVCLGLGGGGGVGGGFELVLV